MIAAYCETSGAKREAIEFLVLAGRRDEAFIIAQSHQEMDEYAAIILKVDEKNVEEHLKIAQYYEGKSQWGKAARHYYRADNYQKALKLFISEGESVIPDMIEMVSKVKIEALTHELVDYLMGETDGVPKEPQWTFKLYSAIGNVKQAVKIAINISHQEQEAGNYKYAHDVLLDTYKDIKAHQHKIPLDLNNKLMLIHSYQLTRRLIKMGNHAGAARLLGRICNNISQFPASTVKILTTCVAECAQAGLKKEAYKWSTTLVRPEYIDQVNPKFKKKVESIARKPVKADDDPEPLTPCPHCQYAIPETCLECPSCKSKLPFCMASGKHMVISEWSSCPACKMCANYGEFKRVLESEPVCPMCEEPVPPMSIKLADNPDAEFKALAKLMQAPSEKKEEADVDGDGMDSDDAQFIK
jgi:WD repeat-containing protein 19